MFEEYTYEKLLDDVLANAPQNIDTRPGSIFYDSVSGILLKIAKLYTDIDMVAELVSIDTATGEYLDDKAGEHSVTRLAATPARYYFVYEGDEPEVGERFYHDGIYFVLKRAEDEQLYLEAELAGTEANDIYAETPAIPVNNIPNLSAASFGEIMELGTDEESDDDLRDRLREKMSGPAENGNKQHYRTWCEEVEGVGRARIMPLWKGPNTVKGIIIDPDGKPATDALIEKVQTKIDPDNDGDGEGDGLGEGVANLGAHFTAVKPEECSIQIAFNAVLTGGATQEQTVKEATEAISEYLKGLTLNTPDEEAIVVRISAVGAIINGLASILDYNSLTFNGETANIEPGNEAVAVIGGVTVNVL